MTNTTCRQTQTHCTGCGSTDHEDMVTGDQGYSACCNEPVSHGTCSHEHD